MDKRTKLAMEYKEACAKFGERIALARSFEKQAEDEYSKIRNIQKQWEKLPEVDLGKFNQPGSDESAGQGLSGAGEESPMDSADASAAPEATSEVGPA